MTTKQDAKKAYIKTYGCQMNTYDSERMADVLIKQGYDQTDTADDADLIILNTCHIREKAAEKVYSELGRLRVGIEKRDNKDKNVMVAVAGCVAQAEGEEIAKRAPVVDMVFGPQVYHRLPELISRVEAGEKVVATEFPEEEKFDHLPAAPKKIVQARGKSAFVTVQEGCDKFCTFCVVPYTRGAEISRPVNAIYDECQSLIDSGVVEISLLGQNVNAYHGLNKKGQSASLAELIHQLTEIDGLHRIRYTTSHPRDMSDDLIDAHGSIEKLMPYLHLPIQSGSDKILASMNRKHTAEFYLDIMDRLLNARPDMALSSDFIVGFPGETDEDFNDTMEIVEKVRYAQAYSFKYSPRPGTPGADMDDQVEEQVKSDRLTYLQERLRFHQRAFNESCVGKTFDVLIDREGRKDGQLAGRSPYLQAVQLDASNATLGTVQPVTITSSGSNSLFGVLGNKSECTKPANQANLAQMQTSI